MIVKCISVFCCCLFSPIERLSYIKAGVWFIKYIIESFFVPMRWQARRRTKSLHLYAPPYCVYMYDNPVIFTMARGTRKCFALQPFLLDVFNRALVSFNQKTLLTLQTFRNFRQIAVSKLYASFNSLSPSPSI